MPDASDKSFYLEHLKEQIGFLVDHCSKYDNGHTHYAKQISTIVRTLVKDNPKNKHTISLLKALGIKDTMRFYNTGYRALNPLFYVGLVGLIAVPSRPPQTNPIDYLYLSVFEDSILIDVQWISFAEWWDSPVLIKKSVDSSINLNRRDMILTMAEQDGGVHVDKHETTTSDYFSLTRGICHMFKAENDIWGSRPVKNIQNALVRQIAHELLISLGKEFDISLNYKWSNDYYLNGVNKEKIYQATLFARDDVSSTSVRTNNPYRAREFEKLELQI